MNIPEYKTTTIEKQKFILSHYGVGKSCWDWLILVVSFYVAIVVPYNATFKDKKQETGECHIDSIDILVEVVFVIGEPPSLLRRPWRAICDDNLIILTIMTDNPRPTLFLLLTANANCLRLFARNSFSASLINSLWRADRCFRCDIEL